MNTVGTEQMLYGVHSIFMHKINMVITWVANDRCGALAVNISAQALDSPVDFTTLRFEAHGPAWKLDNKRYKRIQLFSWFTVVIYPI